MQPTLTYTNAQGESITFGPLMPYHVDLSANRFVRHRK